MISQYSSDGLHDSRRELSVESNRHPYLCHGAIVPVGLALDIVSVSGHASVLSSLRLARVIRLARLLKMVRLLKLSRLRKRLAQRASNEWSNSVLLWVCACTTGRLAACVANVVAAAWVVSFWGDPRSPIEKSRLVQSGLEFRFKLSSQGHDSSCRGPKSRYITRFTPTTSVAVTKTKRQTSPLWHTSQARKGTTDVALSTITKKHDRSRCSVGCQRKL